MMDARETLDRILEDLCPGLALDADGEAAVETDDGDDILVSVSEPTGQVVLSAAVADLASDDRAEVLAAALEVNLELTLTGPARICYLRQKDMLLLRYAAPLEGLNGAGLSALIVAMLELAEPIRDHLAAGASLHEEAGAGEAAAPDRAAPLGFIRA